MARMRRIYTPEFKIEAVKLVTEMTIEKQKRQGGLPLRIGWETDSGLTTAQQFDAGKIPP